jgi:hypothetical protein
MVKNGVVDKNVLLDGYAWNIVSSWAKMAPLIALSRDVTGENAILENFEHLAVLSEDWSNTHTSTYPAGMRGMEIKKPSSTPAARPA